jgi:hypothetical protein
VFCSTTHLVLYARHGEIACHAINTTRCAASRCIGWCSARCERKRHAHAMPVNMGSAKQPKKTSSSKSKSTCKQVQVTVKTDEITNRILSKIAYMPKSMCQLKKNDPKPVCLRHDSYRLATPLSIAALMKLGWKIWPYQFLTANPNLNSVRSQLVGNTAKMNTNTDSATDHLVRKDNGEKPFNDPTQIRTLPRC